MPLLTYLYFNNGSGSRMTTSSNYVLHYIEYSYSIMVIHFQLLIQNYPAVGFNDTSIVNVLELLVAKRIDVT